MNTNNLITSSIIGVAQLKDTARVNEFLAIPQIRQLFPSDRERGSCSEAHGRAATGELQEDARQVGAPFQPGPQESISHVSDELLLVGGGERMGLGCDVPAAGVVSRSIPQADSPCDGELGQSGGDALLGSEGAGSRRCEQTFRR